MRQFDAQYVSDVTAKFNELMGKAVRSDKSDVRHLIGLYSCVSESMNINDDGSVSFLDLAGRTFTAYKSGRVTVEQDGFLVDDKDGIQLFKRERLGKDNGYVYASIRVTPDDIEHDWMAGVHSIVAMCFMLDDYLWVADTNDYNNVCVNHMNNRAWDNRVGDDGNLEWVTQKQNRAHGAMISVLFGSTYGRTVCDVVYTGDKSGLNKRKSHVVLKEDLRLSAREIDTVAWTIRENITRVAKMIENVKL